MIIDLGGWCVVAGESGVLEKKIYIYIKNFFIIIG